MQIFPQGKLPEVFYSLVFPQFLFLAQQKSQTHGIYSIFSFTSVSPYLTGFPVLWCPLVAI